MRERTRLQMRMEASRSSSVISPPLFRPFVGSGNTVLVYLGYDRGEDKPDHVDEDEDEAEDEDGEDGDLQVLLCHQLTCLQAFCGIWQHCFGLPWL
jgi:hypothetical protein